MTEKTTESPLQQRCRVIADTIGLAAPSPERPLASLIDSLRSSTLEIRSAIWALYQAAFARLPQREDIVQLVTPFERASADDLAAKLVATEEFRTGMQNVTRLQRLPKGGPAIAVTHTVSYPHNSGIQRVVRSTARRLRDACLPHTLICFDKTLNHFRLLDERETALLYDWEQMARAATTKTKSRYTRKVGEWLLGRRLNESIKAFTRTWKSFRRKPNLSAGPAQERIGARTAVFIWNDQLLLPELLEPQWIDVVQGLLAHSPVVSTLVLYDLIPIKSPEFCVSVVDCFVRNLNLIRDVDRVSCISEAVADDLRSMLPLLERKRPGPEIVAQHLGGDFDFRDESKESGVNRAGELPLVLSVGTIEVRKNHWRTLRALAAAQRRGAKFRAVFAGNPGWLNESFLAELKYCQSQGFQVELRTSVSEAELSALYQSAALTVYCSLSEGFGLPIVESVRKGVPCLTSDRGSMLEIAERIGGCVTVNPESETDIADAVCKLLGDAEKLAALKAEAEASQWPTWADYAGELYVFASAPRNTAANLRTVA